MKFTKLVKADWQEEWFDIPYFMNKIEKELSNFTKRERMPITWQKDGNKVIITIKEK